MQYRVFQLFYYFFTVSFLLENTYFNMKILEMLKMYLTANTRHRVQNPHYKNTLNILKTRDAPRPRQSDRDTASDDCTFLFSLLYFQLFFFIIKMFKLIVTDLLPHTVLSIKHTHTHTRCGRGCVFTTGRHSSQSQTVVINKDGCVTWQPAASNYKEPT